MATMRAKLMVMNVESVMGRDAQGQDVVAYERLRMSAVGHSKPYNPDGSGDEDSTFSRWTPMAQLDMTIQNPVLFGSFKAGDKFYVDFTPVEVAATTTDADPNSAADSSAA